MVPSSKSHTIRGLLIAAMAREPSEIRNALDSADTRSCIAALEALGVSCHLHNRSATGMTVTVDHRGSHENGIAGHRDASPVAIDVGNSGTTLYLLTALAAVGHREVTFDGDSSIRTRSAGQLLQALTAMGATVTGGPRPPYTVRGPLAVPAGRPVAVESPTSQYLSALLLAAPLLDAREPGAATAITPTVLNEHPYVDLTCWWLENQGIHVERQGYTLFRIPAGQRYAPVNRALPGDYSSATFWFCAAALGGCAGNPESSVTVQGLDPEDVQGDRGVLDILQEMGCRVEYTTQHGVPEVTVTGPLTRGGTFDLNAMPDALPALAALGCYAPEPVTLTNVPQAREKETDRIAVMARELNAIGGRVRELPDGLVVEPVPRGLAGGTATSHGDHRVAMALAVAALGARAPVSIHNASAAAVTYPAFFQDLAAVAPESLP